MLDMGPYYLTALLHLLGPAKRLAGMTSIAIPERIITSEAKRGQTMKVDVPDHYCGSIEFANGVVGSIIQSFAMRNTPKYPQFVVCGTKATMLVPDPNGFDGKVKLKTEGDEGDFVEQEMTHPTGYGRSVGLADLAYAIQSGRPHRCSGRQAYVVLDMMQGFQESGKTGRFHEVAGGYERPAPMPTDLPQGQLDQ
jgi:predicted dehydrogenase